MMQRNQPILDVGSSAEFGRRAEQDTHLTGANLGKQLRLFGFGRRLMDKSNFFLRNALCHQFIPHIIVDIKTAVAFRRGQVTENQLGGSNVAGFLPDRKGIFDTVIYLTVRLIREKVV